MHRCDLAGHPDGAVRRQEPRASASRRILSLVEQGQYPPVMRIGAASSTQEVIVRRRKSLPFIAAWLAAWSLMSHRSWAEQPPARADADRPSALPPLPDQPQAAMEA